MCKLKYDLTSKEFLRDPYPVFKQMRKYDPVYWSPQLDGWVVTNHVNIKLVLNNPDLYRVAWPDISKDNDSYFRNIISNMFIFLTGERRTLIKSTIQPLLSSHVFPQYEDFLRETMANLFRKGKQNGGMKFMRDFTYPLCIPFFNKLFEFSESGGYGEDPLYDQLQDLMDSLANPYNPELSRNADVASEIVMNRFLAVVAKRRAEPDNGFVSRFIQACPDDEAACFMLVGFCTATYNLIYLLGNAMFILLRHPRQMDKLRVEPSLIDACVEEILRYDGPFFALYRIARENTKLGEKRVRKDNSVICMLSSGNRDEEIYDNAECFDVTRRAKNHFATGQGMHHCPAAGLSRRMVRAMLQIMLEVCPDIYINESETWQWATNSIVRRRVEEFQVEFSN